MKNTQHFNTQKTLLNPMMHYVFFVFILFTTSLGTAADNILSIPFPSITPYIDIQRSHNNILPNPTTKEKTLSIKATPGIYRFFDQLEITVTSHDSDSTLEVILDTVAPKHGNIAKQKLRLKEGTNNYKLHLGGVGLHTQFSQLRFNLQQRDEDSFKAIEINSIVLNATRQSLKRLNSDLENNLCQPLSNGLSPKALKTGENKRQEIKLLADNTILSLENPSISLETANQALNLLYDLRDFGANEIQRTALRQESGVNGSLLYGWTGGADKILRDGVFLGHIGGTAKVSLARNEAEACQIAIYSLNNLENITVTLSQFVNDKGDILSNAKATVIGYITTRPPAYFSEYAPYALPDPLLEYLDRFNIDAEKFQPLWLEFAAAAAQPAGIYRGSIQFHQNAKTILSVPVEVTVHKFCLPDRMTFPAVISNGVFSSPLYESDAEAHREFNNYMFDENGGDPTKLSPKAQRLAKINDGLFRLLNAHHITYQDIYRSTRRVIPAWRRQKINQFNSLYCLGYDNDKNVMQNFARQFEGMRKEGTADRAYIYGNDEIRTSDKRAFEGMKRSYGALKKAFPELRTMATALDYSFGEKTDTTEEVDIWVVPPGAYMNERAAASRARKRGKQVWYYPCNWPYPPDANFLLENRATASRLICGLMAWGCEVDGILYYSTGMLQRQVMTESLLKKWETQGNTNTVTLAPWDFYNGYRLKNDKESTAQLSQWTMLPKNPEKPLILEFEALPESLPSNAENAFEAELRINYTNGKTDRTFVSLPINNTVWQKFRREIHFAGPIKNILCAFRLKTKNSSVQVRNIRLYQSGEYSDRRLSVEKIVTGGPVLGSDYCYSVFRSNGDGTLYYPGPNGLMPSIRMKFIRDGLEDYEYMVLLKRTIATMKVRSDLSPEQHKWLKKAEEFLSIPDSVCHSLSKYTKTGDNLLDFREQIAQLLDQVN